MTRLLACEGIDGSGKSTLARLLATALGATLTSEPTRGPHGMALRQAFAAGKRFALSEERRLFELDRREHMAQVVRPRLAQGTWVISDRTYFSSAAYQGTSIDDALSIVRDNEAFAVRPDIVLYLDLPPAFALARIQARGEGVTAMESYENLRACAKRYEAVWAAATANGIDVVRLDASNSPAEIAAIALNAVRSRYPADAARGEST